MFPDTELLIDGRWRPGATKRTLDVLNPATGEVIGTAAVADAADLDEALAAAQKGFRSVAGRVGLRPLQGAAQGGRSAA